MTITEEAGGLPGNATRVGALLNERLCELLRDPHVGDVRGLGLMCAVELVANRDSREPLLVQSPCAQAQVACARQESALVRVQGNRLILSPPLVFTPAHVNEAMTIRHSAFVKAEQT